MARITIYVPDEVARRLRKAARRSGKSLSAFVTEAAAGRRETREWPDWLFDIQGSCEGSLKVPEDAPPEDPGERP